MSIREILKKVKNERKKQIGMLGNRRRTLIKWVSILGKEYGNACEFALEYNCEKYEKALIKVMAIALMSLKDLTSY